MKRLFGAGAALATVALPIASHAASTFTTGSGTPITASAALDFSIVIPKILYVQVGTGTAYATNATVNEIVYTVPATSVGNGTSVAGVGGDLTGGVVTAQVIGNNGNVTFSSTTLGTMNDGATHTISYTQISTTAATLTSATVLAPPALADGATTTETLTAVANVVNQNAKWTFSYLNQNVVAQGTYGGVNTNNSRVTYTASMP